MSSVSSLFEFIKKSPSAYHCVDTVSQRLLKNGYKELLPSDKISLVDGGRYFIRKNGTSVIAFRYRENASGFMICASHSDSPAFKVKNDAKSSAYAKLEVEKYGGMLCYSWLDRPLSIAGRVMIKTDEGALSRLVDFERDLAVIPSLAIHMNRSANDGFKINPAVDMLPIFSSGEKRLNAMLADELSVEEDKILSHDLFLYVREEGRSIGADGEFIASPRLDDLECVSASVDAFLSADDTDAVPVLAVFDNEEVGSETKQGAASSFLHDVLLEISKDERTLRRMLASSFMISADNAHARHPNHPELSDATNAPVLNSGVVLKFNASQRYTSDSFSAAVLKTLAERSGVSLQSYYNRADIPGGSTLGSISNTKVSLPTVDIGLPQLAMHSAVETAGADDYLMMIKLLTEFYSSAILVTSDEIKIIK